MLRVLALAALPLAFAAPLSTVSTAQAPSLANKYIVVMDPAAKLTPRGTNILQTSLFSSLRPTHQYTSEGLTGFAAKLNPAQLAALKADSSVLYVEADGWLHTQVIPHAVKTSLGSPSILDAVNIQTQTNSTWGLGRLSHKSTNQTEYRYDSSAGAGTCAYIIDTGLYAAHAEFEGRAIQLKNFDQFDKTDDDLFGHGTHVAGTIGSRAYGVAKKTTLLGIKVCNSLGLCLLSDIVAAMLLAVEDSKHRAACSKGAVINMSLGAPNADWASLKQTVKTVSNAGVMVVVAAGNEAHNAADYSPASAPEACTIGATDKNDRIADFSNFGADVAVFAPGVDVLSTSPMGPNANAIMSGTSMATPHMAGLAAYFLGLAAPNTAPLTPAAMCQYIRDKSISGLITGLPAGSGTVNRLANNGLL